MKIMFNGLDRLFWTFKFEIRKRSTRGSVFREAP
jgi:hypothetical protein